MTARGWSPVARANSAVRTTPPRPAPANTPTTITDGSRLKRSNHHHRRESTMSTNMSTPTTDHKPMGRPRSGRPWMVKVSLTLPEEMIEQLRELGNGSISAGVRVCVEARMEKQR